MTDTAENTRRLAKNTILLYLRSLFSLFVSLYSSRLILDALGFDDAGIYNVVGSFASMFWLASGSMSAAISRFITVEQGRGDQERINRMFSMSLNIMAALTVVAVLASLLIGPWYLHGKTTIPPDRMDAAMVVFYLSIVTVISGFLIVPFNATIIAREKMGIFAFIGVAEAIIRLLLALFLAFGTYSMDRLILYAALTTVGTLGVQVYCIIYCVKSFPECRIRPVFDKAVFKDMFSFTGWTFMGTLATSFSGQGVNLVVNRFFSVAMNTARGQAGTIENVVSILVKNFTMALGPQITKAYARGETGYFKSLVFMGTKFCFFIMLFFALPIILETDFLLNLWLVEVPPYTSSFVKLTMGLCLLGMLDGIFGKAQSATGKVRSMQIAWSFILFLNFPLSYLLLKAGAPPEATYVIAILLVIPRIISILVITHKSVGFSFREVVTRVYGVIFLATAAAVVLPTILCLTLPYGWKRFLIVGTASVICTALSSFFIGCTKEEQGRIKGFAKDYIQRHFPTRQSTQNE